MLVHLKGTKLYQNNLYWKDFVPKQLVTIGVHLPRDEAKEKISRLLRTGSQAHFVIQLHWEGGGGVPMMVSS